MADEKTMLWVGGAALAALVVGAVDMTSRQSQAGLPGYGPSQGGYGPQSTPLPSGTVTETQGSPVSWFIQGNSYTFSVPVSAGVVDAATQANVLVANGWTNVQIIWFGPQAQGIQTMPVDPATQQPALATTSTNLVATAVWGQPSAPVPSGIGVQAIAGSFPPTNPVAQAGMTAQPTTAPQAGSLVGTEGLGNLQQYTFIGTIPGASSTLGPPSAGEMAQTLKNFGWGAIQIISYAGSGDISTLPGSISALLTIPTGQFTATAQWNGQGGTPVSSAGVTAAAYGSFPSHTPITSLN